MEELTDADLKLLFKDDLYLISEEKHSEPTKEKSKIEISTIESTIAEEPKTESLKVKFKGENAKGIVVVIKDDTNEYLNNSDETLLLNILKAIGLSFEDIALINQQNAGIKWQKELPFTKVIVFGILPSTYGLVSESYKLLNEDNRTWLFSNSLFALDKEKALKGKLWKSLKELFN